MSEMVERVARALFAVRMDVGTGAGLHEPYAWEEENNAYREHCLREARAAIEAMRLPTQSMEYAGGTKLENLMYGGDPEYTGISFTDMGIVFREMIDAGLNPSPQPNDKSPAELESNSTTTM